MEYRETPNDIVSVLQTGFAPGGLLLLSGRFTTPLAVILHGWESLAAWSPPATSRTVAFVRPLAEDTDSHRARFLVGPDFVSAHPEEAAASSEPSAVTPPAASPGMVDAEWLSTVESWLAGSSRKAEYAETAPGGHDRCRRTRTLPQLGDTNRCAVGRWMKRRSFAANPSALRKVGLRRKNA
jgi:hypothetical protein